MVGAPEAEDAPGQPGPEASDSAPRRPDPGDGLRPRHAPTMPGSGSLRPSPPAVGVGPPVTASSGSVNVGRTGDPQCLTSKPPPTPVTPLPVPRLG